MLPLASLARIDNMDFACIKRWFHQRWGWVVVAATFVTNLVLFGLMYTFGVIFDALQEEFGSNATVTGWIGAIPIALTVLLAPLYTVLIERVGHRAATTAGVVLAAVGAILTSFMPVLPPIYVTYGLIFGNGGGLINTCSIALILRYFPTKNCVRACSIALAGTSAGMLSFAPLVFFLRTRFGWRVVMQTMGAAIFAVGFPCIFGTFAEPGDGTHISSRDRDGMSEKNASPQDNTEFDRLFGDQQENSPSKCNENVDSKLLTNPSNVNCNSHEGQHDSLGNQHRHNSADNNVEGSKETKLWRRLKKAVTYPELWFICVIVLNNGMCSGFYYINTVNYLTSVGFTVENGSRIISVIGISEMIANITLSFLGDYIPFPRIFQQIIISVMGCTVVGCLFVVRTMGPMICIATVIGAILATVNVLTFTLASEVFGPERVVETWSIINCCNGIGYLFGSVLGQSIDRTGSYDGAIWAVIGMYLTSGILCFAVPVYQRVFARERFVMMDLYRRNKNSHKEDKATELKEHVLLLETGSQMVISERVTSV